MNEMAAAGFGCLGTALLCTLLGIAVATGKLPSDSAAAARDPARARRAEGVYLVAVGTAIGLMGAAVLASPERMTDTVGGGCTAVIVVGSLVGLVPVFRAHRS